MLESQRNGPDGAATLFPSLREEIGDALERLSRLLLERVPDPLHGDSRVVAGDDTYASLQQEMRFLGQVASGWQHVPESALLEDAAGFGAQVEVEDVERGGRERYTLMAGALLDIDAGQVSLASPIGQALLGARSGQVVTVDTPQRRRTLRVRSVLTLRQRLQRVDDALSAEEMPPPAA